MALAKKKDESTIAPIALDNKDILILRLLQENARITVKEISGKIH